MRTLLLSGNVVLTSSADPRVLERDLAMLLRRAFGFDIAVVVRTRDELSPTSSRTIPSALGPTTPRATR